MMMGKGEKNLLLRFNLNRKTDREIWEWLHEKSESQTLSMNAFLIEGLRKLMALEANEKPLDVRALAERNPRWRQRRRSLPTFWILPTAFDAFKMIARGLGAAINLKARIGGAEEAAIQRKGTGEAAASPVLSAEPTTLCSSSG